MELKSYSPSSGAVQNSRHPALSAGRRIPPLIEAGDAGSESGMTELRMNVLLSRLFWDSLGHSLTNS